MSFSYDVKDELFTVEQSLEQENMECCIHAFSYGLLLFCRGFSTSYVNIQTENELVANLYKNVVENILHKEQKINCSNAGKYSIVVEDKSDRIKILEYFGHTGKELSLRINRANLYDECCINSFVRGVFLSCGTVTEPTKNYHLEFVVSHKNLCNDLIKLLDEINVNAKYVLRKGNHVAYFKDSESIEDVLGYMGAVNSSLKVMEVKIYKDVRNKVNRKINFESANLTKTVDAAVMQIHAIETIQNSKGLSYLNDELRELAEIRIENPELSLRELGERLSTPLSRSGVNHRLKKIINIAQELEK